MTEKSITYDGRAYFSIPAEPYERWQTLGNGIYRVGLCRDYPMQAEVSIIADRVECVSGVLMFWSDNIYDPDTEPTLSMPRATPILLASFPSGSWSHMYACDPYDNPLGIYDADGAITEEEVLRALPADPEESTEQPPLATKAR